MPSHPRLTLSPFRGVRFDPAVVGDLSAVTSPPYDVMDRPMIGALLDQHHYNVVRLTLPRLVCDPMTGDDPYDRAARRLERWRSTGALVADALPSLYVYQYGSPDALVTGVVGTVGLHEPVERVILPHEGVIEAVVDDRLAMMSASASNLEPILLVYGGQGESEPLLRSVMAGPPLIDVTADDATVHRVWRTADPGHHAALARQLVPHQALIADGHHRYAAYLRLRDKHAAADKPGGAWHRGLALLVDDDLSPLELAAIHRTDPELSLTDLTSPSGGGASPLVSISPARPAPNSVSGMLPRSAGEIVVTDGRSIRVVSRLDRDGGPGGGHRGGRGGGHHDGGAGDGGAGDRHGAGLAGGGTDRGGTDRGGTHGGGTHGRESPAAIGASDVALLHELLLPAWGVDESRLGFHHSPEQALAAVTRDGGIAFMLHPTTVTEVLAVARHGQVMPRKSTSFGPKPRTGLIMRILAEDESAPS